jgi:hypothetical protein
MRRAQVLSEAGSSGGGQYAVSVTAPTDGWTAPVEVLPGRRWSLQASGTIYLRTDRGGPPILVDPRKPGRHPDLVRSMEFRSAGPEPVTVTIAYPREH